VSEADAARADPPLHVLFKKERNFVALEMEISEPLKYLLDRCTGERTVRELVDEVAERYGASEPALQDDVLALMRDLTTKGVIHLSQ